MEEPEYDDEELRATARKKRVAVLVALVVLAGAGAVVGRRILKVIGTRTLMGAVRTGDHPLMLAMLRVGGNPNQINPRDGGASLLQMAAEASDTTAVKALLRAGAVPNMVDASGRTPLIMAAYTGNLECVKALVKHGADINVQRIDGETALRAARTAKRRAVVEYLVQIGARG